MFKPVAALMALAVALPFAAHADMSVYVKFDNSSLAGDVTASGHVGWINAKDLQMGESRSITSTAGAAKRQASSPALSDLKFTKSLD
jgi:type VI protein secretion system component Hcp